MHWGFFEEMMIILLLFLQATMATPWVDVRLTVRRMRRVYWTVERTGGQVAEAIVCFGMTAPKGRGWF